MSILEGIEKSKIQKKYDELLAYIPLLANGEKNRAKGVFNMLWNDINTKEEAQSLMDLFGTNAGEMFLFYSAWQSFIKSIDPSYEILETPFEKTINEDGTVTISNKIEESV